METPKREKECDNDGFIPRRLLCENPATGNETIPLSDLKELWNVSACNADKSTWEFYEDEATSNETVSLSDVKKPSNVSACNADKSSWEFYKDVATPGRETFYKSCVYAVN